MPPAVDALFFLDEATALAAGHRPCGYCRHRDFVGFAAAWQATQSLARSRGLARWTRCCIVSGLPGRGVRSPPPWTPGGCLTVS